MPRKWKYAVGISSLLLSSLRAQLQWAYDVISRQLSAVLSHSADFHDGWLPLVAPTSAAGRHAGYMVSAAA